MERSNERAGSQDLSSKVPSLCLGTGVPAHTQYTYKYTSHHTQSDDGNHGDDDDSDKLLKKVLNASSRQEFEVKDRCGVKYIIGCWCVIQDYEL